MLLCHTHNDMIDRILTMLESVFDRLRALEGVTLKCLPNDLLELIPIG